MRAEPTRRALLGAAAASALLAGCKGITALGPLPRVVPDVVTLEHAITAEELMIARYEAAQGAVTADASVTAVVSGLLAQHREHLTALRSRLVLPERLVSAKPKPNPTAPPPATGTRQVLAELAAAERTASDTLARQLLDVPGPLAQLMASIAASEAAHVVVLGQIRPGR